MLAALIPAILSALFKEGFSAFREYQQGKITLAQLQNKLAIIGKQEATKVEAVHADALKSTYATFGQTMINSRLVRWVWAIVTLMMAFIVFWYAFAVPLIIWHFGGTYPSAGSLIDYAYWMLGFCLGGGPVILKATAPKRPV